MKALDPPSTRVVRVSRTFAAGDTRDILLRATAALVGAVCGVGLLGYLAAAAAFPGPNGGGGELSDIPASLWFLLGIVALTLAVVVYRLIVHAVEVSRRRR